MYPRSFNSLLNRGAQDLPLCRNPNMSIRFGKNKLEEVLLFVSLPENQIYTDIVSLRNFIFSNRPTLHYQAPKVGQSTARQEWSKLLVGAGNSFNNMTWMQFMTDPTAENNVEFIAKMTNGGLFSTMLEAPFYHCYRTTSYAHDNGFALNELFPSVAKIIAYIIYQQYCRSILIPSSLVVVEMDQTNLDPRCVLEHEIQFYFITTLDELLQLFRVIHFVFHFPISELPPMIDKNVYLDELLHGVKGLR